MRRQSPVLKSVNVFRLGAIVATCVAAGIHQALVGNWVAVVAAVGASAALAIWGSETRRRNSFVAGGFVVLGILLVWGFRESLIWISLAGSLGLVTAVDLDRLACRFPVASPLAAQRALFVRHLASLLTIGAVSGVSALSVQAVTLELQLAAVMLLALFCVVVLAQIVQAIRSGDRRE